MRRWNLALALVLAGVALAAATASAAGPSITSICTLTATGEQRSCDAWFPGEVSVVWSVVPPVTTDCPAAQQVTVEGITTIPCIATILGSTASAGVTIHIDKTPPS